MISFLKHFGLNKPNKLLLVCLMFIGMYPDTFSQKYFQQKVNFKIDVTLNDKRHELSAFEKVEYINNSPDTLKFLYFHLWPNAYSGNNTDLAKQLFSSKGKERLFKDPELNGYMPDISEQPPFTRSNYFSFYTFSCQNSKRGYFASGSYR